MALFQTSVLNKYLTDQYKDFLLVQYNIFKSYFLNPTIQNNIIAQKEEQFQEGFLRELFVKVLGYTINPEPDFNLTTELKNIKDAKKADGAIINQEKVLAVIELKGTDTTNLTKIEQQAFNYKNNQEGCRYVITSNFQKLRFYIDNAIEHIEWDLFKLDLEGFNLLYLCLAKANIFNDLPAKIKTDSVTQEEQVTKQLYKEYSQFRKSLFNNIVELNTNYNKLELFKKTQKLLDRFLFLFFAEDRLLVPPNSVRMILAQWTELKEKFDEYQPLYDRFKKYFGYLNTGYVGKQHEIFAYNGGLFAPDEILDSIKIDDSALYDATLALSNYDYNSEVDVNILGHIFEHSLTEIEELEKEITSTDKAETKTSKRKKDGVFYTPKYITKYIVENTVGTLCKNKKEELKLQEEDYHKLTKKTKKELYDKLMQYKDWLLQITIIDPACGSGAFLNQALEFLIAEHKWISELEANITNSSIVFDVESSILENNIFGVDINEESVEIAKLSLWLRTARKGRKLNSLNNNIKCGNSLIDDPAVAGDKAFNWQKEFPQIFKTKELEAFHVVLTTHNSRTSQRMIKYDVVKGDPVELDSNQEIELTKIIGGIIKEKNYQCIAYNICKDHIHLIIVCEKAELAEIIKNIKGKSSFLFQSNGFKPIGESLWSQKFFRANLDVWQLNTISNLPGYLYNDTYLDNAINYIIHNREKHNLPHLPELESLINNFIVSQEEAFQQQSEGGFDVVIGNPPYVFARENFNQAEKNYYVLNYESAKYQVNLYLLFIERAIKKLKQNGNYGLIIPNAWLMVYSGEGLRKYILENCSISKIINLKGYSFENVNVETVILVAKKTRDSINNELEILLNNGYEFYYSHSKNQNEFKVNNGYEFKVFTDNLSDGVNSKLLTKTIKLDDLVEIKAGLQAYEKDKGEPKQTATDVINRPYDYKYKFDDSTLMYLDGKDVGRYYTNWSGLYLKYGKHLAAPRTFNLFSDKKIIVREITGNYPRCIIATYSEDTYLYNRSNIGIVEKINSNISLKYIVSILNSKLLSYYFLKNTAKSVRKLFPKIILNDLRNFPIKNISEKEQNPFIEKADILLSKNKELLQANTQFQKLLTSKFSTLNINTKLEKWYELSFADFMKELSKQFKTMGLSPLTLSEQSEWLQFFEQEKQKVLTIKNEIDKTDKEIDQMVYQLYGLTEDEIKIVEGK